MRKLLLSIVFFVFFLSSYSQAIISGLLANPAGTDAPYEYVQFVATQAIDFSVTNYSVVWSNNGTATSNGWAAGAAITYKLNITSGSVAKGETFYVGGSGKLINGSGSTDISAANWVRTINTGTTAGDGFGNLNSTGSIGNGGTSADGIAIFTTTTVTSTTVPIDAVFFGTGVGGAKPATGGYVMPTNDRYDNAQGTYGNGTNTYLFPDVSASPYIRLIGAYNTNTNTWTSARIAETITLTSTSVLTDINPKIALTDATVSYYSKSAGDLRTFINWTTIADGTGTSPTSFSDPNTLFVVNRPAGTTSLTADLTISGTLIVNSGHTLATSLGARLVLASNSTSTAKVGISYGSFFGDYFAVERYIPGGRRAFRFLSHPFTTSLNLNSVTDDIDITGDGGTSPMTATGSNNASAFGYDNASANSSLSSDPGWAALLSTSTFDAKKGYRILVRGAKGEGLNGSAYTPSAVTLSWMGTLNSGDQIVTLANNGANKDYTLVGNPYASPIDLSLLTRGSNINANFYVWNPNASTSGAYVANAFSSSYILPSGGAFFTQSAGNTNNTITFKETSKSIGTPTNLFRTITQTEDKLVLQVNDANNNYADKLSFYFDNKNYTANNDILWDAIKLTNPDVNFYSLSADDKKLAIDRRPISTENIALGFTAKTLGTYTITVNELPKNNNTYYLRDNYLHTETLLVANTAISFAINSEAASQGTTRFELVMKANPVVLVENNVEVKMSPNPVKDVLTLSYSNPTEATATARIINTKGQVLQLISLGNAAQVSKQLSLGKYGMGVYTVELTIGKERISKQVVKN